MKRHFQLKCDFFFFKEAAATAVAAAAEGRPGPGMMK
jgi:hypothetical protein